MKDTLRKGVASRAMQCGAGDKDGGNVCEIWAKSIRGGNISSQPYPWTASPTPSRSPSAQRWGLTSRRTRPSGRLSPGRMWPGLSKHPDPRKCRKDHLRETQNSWWIRLSHKASNHLNFTDLKLYFGSQFSAQFHTVSNWFNKNKSAQNQLESDVNSRLPSCDCCCCYTLKAFNNCQ